MTGILSGGDIMRRLLYTHWSFENVFTGGKYSHLLFFVIKKYFQTKIYITSSHSKTLQFSKFQHVITGNLCGLGKNCRQHNVFLRKNFAQENISILNFSEESVYFFVGSFI